MQRTSILTLAILVTICASQQTMAQDEANLATAPTAHAPTMFELLNVRIEEVAFEEAPLDQVLEWIDSLTPLNVITRWQQLEDLGIERDQPVTLGVRNLRLSQVLWLLLREAAGPDVRLAFQACDGLLIISTSEDLEREMVVKVYDVADLLLRLPRFAGAPHIDVATNTGSTGGENVFGSTGGASERENSEGADVSVEDSTAAELARLIVSVVEPDSWREVGGPGSIQAFGNLLVVRANPRVHQLLAGQE